MPINEKQIDRASQTNRQVDRWVVGWQDEGGKNYKECNFECIREAEKRIFRNGCKLKALCYFFIRSSLQNQKVAWPVVSDHKEAMQLHGINLLLRNQEVTRTPGPFVVRA